MYILSDQTTPNPAQVYIFGQYSTFYNQLSKSHIISYLIWICQILHRITVLLLSQKSGWLLLLQYFSNMVNYVDFLGSKGPLDQHSINTIFKQVLYSENIILLKPKFSVVLLFPVSCFAASLFEMLERQAGAILQWYLIFLFSSFEKFLNSQNVIFAKESEFLKSWIGDLQRILNSWPYCSDLWYSFFWKILEFYLHLQNSWIPKMSDFQKNQNTWNVGLAICKEFWIPGHTAVTFDIPESLRAFSLLFKAKFD